MGKHRGQQERQPHPQGQGSSRLSPKASPSQAVLVHIGGGGGTDSPAASPKPPLHAAPPVVLTNTAREAYEMSGYRRTPTSDVPGAGGAGGSVTAAPKPPPRRAQAGSEATTSRTNLLAPGAGQEGEQQRIYLPTPPPPVASTLSSPSGAVGQPGYYPATLQTGRPAYPPLVQGASATHPAYPPAGSTANPQLYSARTPHPVEYGMGVPLAYTDGSSAPSGFQVVRKKTVRNIQLTPQGNLVIDIPVPDRVLQMAKYQVGDEFTHMRYTAITCDPNEVAAKGYSLRQQEFGRRTEIFIVVTMYNEDDELFCKSITALMKNIAYLCARSRSKTWGADGWQKVVLCIISDGRAKVNPRVLDVLGVMGVFQEGIMKESVNGNAVTAHVFEYTTQVCVSPDLMLQGHAQGFVPVQVLFCLKERNAKKINSHRWFFNGFGPLLNPNVCVLIDVGTKPSVTSIYHLWKCFDANPTVGGACGEIYTELGPNWSKLLNPLVAAQNFEYKISNILDKPLESVMGYISVLPGAFSAYRYKALQGLPLIQYFKGELLHGGADIFAANMYLAEDRVLCFEIITKKGANWLLRYVKSARAETDVPSEVPEFISQRRRWLNGSFFAGVHALMHFFYIYRSNHNLFRKAVLSLQFVYNFISILFNWFSLSSFYLAFYFLSEGAVKNVATDPLYGYGPAVTTALRQLYIASIVTMFICSLGNRPQGSRGIYTLCMFLFAIIVGIMYYFVGYYIFLSIPKTRTTVAELFRNPIFRDLVISIASTYGMYLTSSILYLDPWHMLTSFPQYMFFLPSFVNILNVYAFCNLHDVSWGTKGDNVAPELGAVKSKDGSQSMVAVEVPTEREDINSYYDKFIRELRQPRPIARNAIEPRAKQEDYFRSFRTNIVIGWMFSNAFFIIVLTNETFSNFFFSQFNVNSNSAFNPYLAFLFYSVLALSTVRFIGSTLYLVLRAIGSS